MTDNTKDICFVCCVSNADYYKKNLQYIRSLHVPDGYSVSMLPIIGATSIFEGYNKAIKLSSAKYKIYLHQDLYILNKFFIKDILDIFSDPQNGLIGVIGSQSLPESCIWWESEHTVGKVIDSHTGKFGLISFQENEKENKRAVAVDGILMATQYDLPWRSDIFSGWHFYDISQSFEFIKKRYNVIVPYQDEPWCLHDCGIANIDSYYENSLIFKKYYHRMLNTSFF